MAIRIPQYQLQVEPRAAPNVAAREEASALSFGAGEAQALQRAGAAVARGGDLLAEHAIKFQVIQNETNVNDVFANQFAPELRKIKREYSNLQGKRAVDAFGETEQRIEKVRTGMRDALPNPEQQRMFDKISRAQTDQDLGAMSNYAATQNKAWKKQTHLSMLQNFVDDASDNMGNPNLINRALKSGLTEIEAFAQENGEDEETLKQAKRNFSTVLHSQVINRMALRSPGAAQAYYEKVKGDLSGEAKVTIERTIRREAEHQEQRAKVNLSIDRGNTGQSLQDYQAGLDSGAVKPTDPPPKEASRENLTRLYPRDPQRVDRILTTVEAWRRKAELTNRILTAPSAQIPAIVTEPGVEPGTPGFKAHAMIQRDLTKTAEAILKNRAEFAKEQIKADMRMTLGVFNSENVDLETWNQRMLQTYRQIEFLAGKDAALATMQKMDAAARAGQELQSIRQGDVGKAQLKASELTEHVERIIDGIPDADGKLAAYFTGIVKKTMDERNQGLTDAPAEYALKYNPAVRAAQQAYLQTPAADPEARARAFQSFAQTMQTALDQYGVAADKKYRLLPEGMVASITDKLTNAGPDQSMARYVKELSRMAGPYWPKVASQLGEKRPELMLMAEASPDSAVAQDLLKILPVDAKELRAKAPNLNESSLRTNINRELGDLRASLPGLQADREYSGLWSGVEKLAIFYIGQGMDADDAVKKAASPITQNYEFRTINGGTVRIPKSAGDPGAIERGIRSFTSNLYRVDLEADWKVYYPGMTEEAARAFKLQAVRARAVAVTVGDQVQFYLKDPNGSAAMVPLRNYGQPIIATFSDILATTPPPRRHRPRLYPGEDRDALSPQIPTDR